MAGNEPSGSGDIKVTPAFLRSFQTGFLAEFLKVLETDPNILELEQTTSSGPGKRRLLAGNEKLFEPARLLIEKYEALNKGTAPTLFTQIVSMRTYLRELNLRIDKVVADVEKGEYDNLQLTSQLSIEQVNAIFSPSPAPPAPQPPPAGS
ncbi:hypothetical protein LFM09_21765 [Lentzea alba]|uniref:hypothetical protein n=1 Tax=Lentzea alba TaxID=2714351 RepID=UPI0039BF0DB1